MNVIAENLMREIDGIQKDFFTKEEILNLLQRLNTDDRQPTIESNGVIVDTETFLVKYKGNTHKFPRKVFRLLYYFISNKNKNITRHELLRDVWGSDVYVGDRTIDVHIRKLRAVLPSEFIKTNKGVGYCWVS